MVSAQLLLFATILVFALITYLLSCIEDFRERLEVLEDKAGIQGVINEALGFQFEDIGGETSSYYEDNAKELNEHPA